MMNVPDKKDAIHKVWLYRILEAIADDRYLSQVLYFKGGTCASMLGWLDRFSVNLDFDYAGCITDIEKTRTILEEVFKKLGLSVKDASKVGMQYFLKYENTTGNRNTIKIDVVFPLFESSTYAEERFIEIDRIFTCQTKETMFAHKLVAIIDRFKKTGHIAGRDIYDINQFFIRGYEYNTLVIIERSGKELKDFFTDLAVFIERHVTEKVITEDLNPLLSLEKFQVMRKVLKRETISLIRDEIARLSTNKMV